MATVKATEAAREIFAEAWKLYTKYLDGPQGDPDIYWHNLAADSDKVMKKYPCGMALDLTKAVLEEHSRRERRNGDEEE